MSGFIETLLIDAFFLCLAISLFLVLSRLRDGPSLADRVVALDLFSTILLSAVVVSSIYVNEVIYFDIAIILALFSFVSSVIFAHFIQNQGESHG